MTEFSAELWSGEICDLVDAAFETVSRNPSDHETAIAYRRAIAAALAKAATERDGNTPETQMEADMLPNGVPNMHTNLGQGRGDDPDEAYEIGKRDGYERAVQDIDLLTGGDGEYRYCTDHDPGRHCPDAEAMKARIAERFGMRERPLTAEQLADALGCFWNAAIGAAHNRQSSAAMDAASVMAEGFSAVADRLGGERVDG